MSKKNIDVGAVNGAVLTILGEKVTITDIGTDRKSETSFLAGARDSGSIIFDNVVTEIDVGNSEINHVGIFAGNGAVTFTENTGILNIGSGTGIYVADNGSFTFNKRRAALMSLIRGQVSICRVAVSVSKAVKPLSRQCQMMDLREIQLFQYR